MGIDAVAWARMMEEYGAGEILLTSMDQDGQKNGYDLALTRAVAEAVSIPVIASGGVGNLEHVYQGLTAGKADAALAASIFHFKEYTIRQAKEYLQERGVPVQAVSHQQNANNKKPAHSSAFLIRSCRIRRLTTCILPGISAPP